MDAFERELEAEFHRVIDPMTAGTIPAWRKTDSGGTMKQKVVGGAGAAIAAKILTGIVAAAAAATVAGAATEVALTGSVNPQDWGQQVTQQVAACKASAARLGVHGIGECVSDFANQHGKAVSASHRASDSRGHGNDGDNGSSNGNGNANANGHSKDKGKSESHGPSSTGTGSPRTSSLIDFVF
jgi:hypothetical protein